MMSSEAAECTCGRIHSYACQLTPKCTEQVHCFIRGLITCNSRLDNLSAHIYGCPKREQCDYCGWRRDECGNHLYFCPKNSNSNNNNNNYKNIM